MKAVLTCSRTMASLHSVYSSCGGQMNTAGVCEPSLERAEQLLKCDGVVALPTDTIYGICCLAQRAPPVHRLYEIKRRQAVKPVAICVAQVEDIHRWAHVCVQDSLLHDLLPGPVTLVFNRKARLNPLLNPQTQRIGIRIPDHAFVRQLCFRLNEPLALTSANISDAGSCASVGEFCSIWPQLDAVFDGGPLGVLDPLKLGSTVVDLSSTGNYEIIRDGCALKQVKEILTKHRLKPLLQRPTATATNEL